jgi:phage FluMu protein Com
MGILGFFKSRKRQGKTNSAQSSKDLLASLSTLNDPQKLAEIAKTYPNTKVGKVAVRRIAHNNAEILQDIIIDADDYKVKIAAVKRIDDQKILSEIYKKCVELDISHSVRSALVKRMKDVPIITEISENDSSSVVRKVAKKRLFSLGPKISAYTVKVDCPHCSNPVMLNGPILTTTCTYCLSELTIPKKFWGYILRVKDSVTYSRLCGFRNVEIKSYLTSVRCSHCNSVIEVADIPAGSFKPIKCSECHTLNTTFPAPKWMERIKKFSRHADQIFCGVSEGEKTSPKNTAMKPVIFSCLQCGGSLKITPETPRVMSCTYCGASQYLPDELWRSLHPVKKKREWFVRWREG